MSRKIFHVILFLAVCCNQAAGQIITTICGDGTLGTSSDGMDAIQAWVANPQGVVKYGDKIYFCESSADKVRFIGPNGLIGTVAGTGVAGYSGDGGLAINARLYTPGPLTTDNAGNIYFIDQSSSVVRKISTSGIITTIAGGQGFGYSGDGGPVSLARFRSITDIHFDNAGNLYIVDWWTSVVRKVNMTTGIITTIIGTGTLGFSGDGGPATAATTDGVYGVVTDNAGNIYVTDAANKRIRKVNTAGIITTIAGTGALGNGGDGGPATAATFSYPVDVTMDVAGNLYVYDTVGVIRKITPAGIISRYAGTGTSGYSGDGGSPLAAKINGPYISIDTDGVMYISDYDNNRIRKIHCPDIIINQQSTDTTICLANGNWGSFYIDAENATGYQWQVNTGSGWTDLVDDGNYASATSPVLYFAYIDASWHNYKYRCRVYNNCSELFSPVINLQVFDPVTPTISITASTNTICPGTYITFTATGINAGSSPNYVWYRNGTPFGTGVTFSTPVLANGDVVTCFLTANNFCATTNNALSNGITMIVNPGPSLAITTPTNIICSGASVTFTATVTNGGTSPAYQWKKNGVNVGTNSNTYTSNILANGDIVTCTYSSTVACGASTLLSNSITMNVNTVSAPAVVIHVQGGCLNAYFSAIVGAPVTYDATITNGGSAPVYQWKKNGANVGTNSPSYTAVVNELDVITCVITSNSTCTTTTTATSNSIYLEFGSSDPEPTISLAASTDMCEAGVPVTFTAIVTGSGSLQWKKNGVNVGTNSNTYTENSPADGDLFSCTITSSSGCVANSTASAGITFSCSACGPPGGIITTIVGGVDYPLGAVKGYGGNIYYTYAAKVAMLTPAGTNIVIAGQNTPGYSGDGGPATLARTSFPAVVVTANDGTIYFNEFTNKIIRKINPAGIISTIARVNLTGGEGSPLGLARFLSLEDIFLDKAQNLYIVDKIACVVKKVNMATNQTYTIAGIANSGGFSGDGGPATQAQLLSPSSVAVDSLGNIYITDEGNYRVRKIDQSGIISTIAGTGVSGKGGDGGPALLATLFKPHDLAVDKDGNVYLGDWGNGVRKITLNGIITRVAGNGFFGYSGDGGLATLAKTVSTNVAVDADNNIYISDFDYNAIRKVSCPVISINRQPFDTTLCNAPGNISFSVRACNSPSYQWQVNTGSGWTDIIDNATYSGVTKSRLNVNATAAMNNYQYRCRVYSTCNTLFSSAALLKASIANTPLVNIISSTGTACQGANSIFTATPQYGGLAPFYQWKKNGINVGSNSNTYTSNTLVNGDQVTCVLTASADECVTIPTATSNTITVTINPTVTPAITITESANNICGGTPVTFTLTSTNGGSAPFYQWQKNGVNAGTGTVYTDNTLNNGDVIRCALISNASCTVGSGWVFSNNITMNTVTSVTPTIAITSSVNNVCAGTGITFNSTITNGGPTPVYQWKKNGVNVGTNSNSHTDNTLNNGDIITCVLTSSSPCATIPNTTSNGVTMTINPITPPSITVAASSTTICAGVPVTFTSAITNGGSTPVYQWKRNGVNVGTNNTSYTDNALNNGDIITCILTPSTTCPGAINATSNPVTMTVNPLLTPSVSITASGNTICAGTPITFSSVINNGGSTPVYQWKKNGVNAGTNTNNYTDNTLNNGDIISCELNSNATCATPATVISNNVTMIVNPLLATSIAIAASDDDICAGNTVTFNSTIANGGTSPIYQWKKNGVNAGTNSNSYTDNTLNNGDVITCGLISNAVCATPVSSASNMIAMRVHDNPVVLLDQTPTLCTGATRQLDAGAFASYVWNTGQLTRSINVTNAGTYTVTVTDNNGCNGNGSSTISTMFPQPGGFLPLDTSFCNFGSLTLQSSSVYNNYTWSTGAHSSSITTNQPGTYWLEVTDNNNCKGKISVVVIMKQCLKGLYVPTAFTPNHDGKNDIFKALLFGDIKKYDLIIYNRWGNMVYRTKDPDKGWDGTFKGSEPPIGVYIWMCSYQLDGGPAKVEKGTVTLIR